MKALLTYYRDNGKPIGCIAAVGRDMVGWSLCSKKDTFSKKMARLIAIGRACKPEKSALSIAALPKCPDSFIKLFEGMYKRAERYFKDEN